LSAGAELDSPILAANRRIRALRAAPTNLKSSYFKKRKNTFSEYAEERQINMQTAYLTNTTTRFQKRFQYQMDIELQPRDLQILSFILDMKFASKEDLALKFFWDHQAAKEKPSFLRARDRIYKLQLNKFIVPVKFQGESKNYYMGTWKAYYAVNKSEDLEIPCRPSKSPDYQNFHHDRYVLQARLHIEQTKKVRDWISDRRLRHFPELAGGLRNSQVPDSIFIDLTGKKVAFELEVTRKDNRLYLEKIKRYLQLIRNQKLVDQVYYVCLKENVKKLLSDSVKIYGDLFKVQTWTEFISENSEIANANPSLP
jgi:hypothetical protein